MKIINQIINPNSAVNNKKQQFKASESAVKQRYMPINYEAAQVMKASVTFKGNNDNRYPLKELVKSNYRKQINNSDISPQRKDACLMVVSTENPDGSFHFTMDKEIKSLSSEKEFSDEQISNILKRRLINVNTYDVDELKLFSDFTEEQWNIIKPMAFKIYEDGKKLESKEILNKLNEFKNDEISVNELYDEYSKIILGHLINANLPQNDNKQNNYTETINEQLQKGDVNSSSLEMLLYLMSKREIPYLFLEDIQSNGKISPEAAEDIEKYFESEISDKDKSDVFICQYDKREDAIKSAKTGDICSLKGEKNIFIKMEDNSLKEIFMPKEIYLKLFPPVERYANKQGNIGDCFLLSSLYSLYRNPKTRHKILEMFKYNENDTSFSIALNGFERKGNEIVKKNKNDFDYKSDYIKLAENLFVLSRSSLGIKLLEDFFSQKAEYNSEKNIKEQYEFFKNAEYDQNGYVYRNGLKYSKSDVEMIVNMIEEYYKNPNDIEKSICSVSATYMDSLFNKTDDLNSVYEKIPEKFQPFFKSVQNRYEQYFKETNAASKEADDIVSFEMLESMYDRPFIPIYRYIDGGVPQKIFKNFGMETKEYSISKDEAELKTILNDKDNIKNYVFCVSSGKDHEYGGIKILGAHSYSLTPVISDDEIKYIITNPFNSIFGLTLNYNQLKNLFESVQAAHV